MVRARLLIFVAFVATMTVAEHPKLTLTYFDLPGRGEAIRLVLYIADIPFNDDRIKREDWPSLKPKASFGQLPILDVDGEVYCQARAILRYVGRLGGLYPSDERLALTVDMILDKLEDIMLCAMPMRSETDPEKKKSMLKSLATDILPTHFSQLDKVICKSSTDYSVGDNLTIADVLMSCYVNVMIAGAEKEQASFDTSPYKNVNSVCETVTNHPRVKDWYQKHQSKSQ